jgi:hypothetical protein
MFRVSVIIFTLLLLAGCQSADSTQVNTHASATSGLAKNSAAAMLPSTAAAKSKIDVCGLLSSDELKSVQGEAYQEAQRSDRQDGDLLVAQCYYQMPTTVNSVVLNVTSAREGNVTRSPKTFWEQTFGRARGREGRSKPNEREKERSEGNPRDRRSDETEAEATPSERVKGLGDEAFWVASRIGGALYVLRRDMFFRISIGGAGEERSKLNKSKTLAQQVLAKL